MNSWFLRGWLAILGSTNSYWMTASAAAEETSPRMTRVVQLVDAIQPAVVAVFTPGKDGGMGAGSGSIIHPKGFILTNHHVVTNGEGFILLADGSVRPFRLVGALPERDMAIVQIPTKEPLPTIPLGWSRDTKVGEPIIVAGNPGGRGIVFSSGIVSSKSIMLDAPNALVMTQFRSSRRDAFIQFDAASNRGNSGGPLVNYDGEQVGIVAAGSLQEQNINFAIPIDRVRELMATAVAAEVRGNFCLGIRLDPAKNPAVVESCLEESPAFKAGLCKGDILQTINGEAVRDSIDFVLMSYGLRPQQEVTIQYQRNGESQSVKLQTQPYPVAETITATDQVAGLHYSLYHLDPLTQLPEFSKLTAARSGTCERLKTVELSQGRADHFGLVFEGFMKIEKSGVYRVIIASDDASRFFLDGTLLVDNDGNHPNYERSQYARLDAGLHPMRIEYMESTGEAALSVSLESENGSLRIGGDELWYRAP